MLLKTKLKTHLQAKKKYTFLAISGHCKTFLFFYLIFFFMITSAHAFGRRSPLARLCLLFAIQKERKKITWISLLLLVSKINCVSINLLTIPSLSTLSLSFPCILLPNLFSQTIFSVLFIKSLVFLVALTI